MIFRWVQRFTPELIDAASPEGAENTSVLVRGSLWGE